MVAIDFLSYMTLADKTLEEKIETIMERVKSGNVVVLEKGFLPDEEMKLINATLAEINNKFTGVEVVSLDRFMGSTWKERLVNRMFPRSPLTVVGPSKTVRKIQKSPGSFSIHI